MLIAALYSKILKLCFMLLWSAEIARNSEYPVLLEFLKWSYIFILSPKIYKPFKDSPNKSIMETTVVYVKPALHLRIFLVRKKKRTIFSVVDREEKRGLCSCFTAILLRLSACTMSTLDGWKCNTLRGKYTWKMMSPLRLPCRNNWNNLTNKESKAKANWLDYLINSLYV